MKRILVALAIFLVSVCLLGCLDSSENTAVAEDINDSNIYNGKTYDAYMI